MIPKCGRSPRPGACLSLTLSRSAGVSVGMRAAFGATTGTAAGSVRVSAPLVLAGGWLGFRGAACASAHDGRIVAHSASVGNIER